MDLSYSSFEKPLLEPQSARITFGSFARRSVDNMDMEKVPSANRMFKGEFEKFRKQSKEHLIILGTTNNLLLLQFVQSLVLGMPFTSLNPSIINIGNRSVGLNLGKEFLGYFSKNLCIAKPRRDRAQSDIVASLQRNIFLR